MDLGLAAGISFCTVEGRTLFLDTVRDRYFALPAAWEDVFLALASRGASAGLTEADLAPLISAGIISEGPPLRDIRACGRIAPVAEAPQQPLANTWSWRIAALIAYARARLALSTRSLDRNLAIFIRDKRDMTSRQGIDDTGLLKLISAFAWCAPYIGTHDTCLSRSLAMAMLAVRHGIPVDWVFGVKTLPFGAHCWIEYRQSVLNDTHEHASLYTPILAL